MPDEVFKTHLIRRVLEDDSELLEAMFFPELSTYGRGGSSRARGQVARQLREIIERISALELHRRRSGAVPEIIEFDLNVDPPTARPDRGEQRVNDGRRIPPPEAWRVPLPLKIHVVRWPHDGHTYLGFIPALGIEVIAESEAELAERVPRHARFALMRSGAARSLMELAHLARVRELKLVPRELAVTIKSPKQAATELAGETQRDKPVLERVGVDLSAQTPLPAWELESVVGQLAEALTGRHARSVLLVGKSGVGKTAALQELVRRRENFELGKAPFWATSGARLVAGMSGFGMWQDRCRRLCAEASKAGAVLCLGNLIELLEVGKSVMNAQGIASFLRPYIARGEILAVAECTPEQLTIIERLDPHLLEVFRQITVEEPTPDVARTILLNFVVNAEPNDSSPIDESGLMAVDQLHRRYATYSAFPARPLRFLRNLLHDRKAESFKTGGETLLPPPRPLTRQNVIAAFARETGLPLFMLDPAVPLDLGETQERFTRRVIGQADACDVVVDLIATVKAALNRPRRPIASLLFIGPTGVGKTEMAKTLAEFFFGDVDRLTRFDMSEYATSSAAERLVGISTAEEGLLTAKVREQPFSVVLLDELEKAHPAVFDLMLQVLGEGRLTDAAGRVADFTNSIIVMTSNLGAQSFRQTPFGLSRGSARPGAAHFVEQVRDFFRPELFNRIDRIVPFEPLDEQTILQIARRELDLIARRDGLRLREVDLQIPKDVVIHLARRGFDPVYGARPLKRTIERELLVPLAEGVNGYAESARLVAQAQLEGQAEAARVSVIVKAATETSSRGAATRVDERTIAKPSDIRRDIQKLQRCAAVVALHNDIFMLQRLKERVAAHQRRKLRARLREQGKDAPRDAFVYVEDERLARLPRLTAIADSIRALDARATELENDLLLGLYDSTHAATPAAEALASLERQWNDVMLSVYSLRFPAPNEINLLFGGRPEEYRFDMIAAYHRIATDLGFSGRAFWWRKARNGKFELQSADTVKELNKGPAAQSPTLALRIEGACARARFVQERGTHRFDQQKKEIAAIMVDTSDKPLAKCAVMAESLPERRRYDLDNGFARDELSRSQVHFPGSDWGRAIARCMADQLAESMRAVLNE